MIKYIATALALFMLVFHPAMSRADNLADLQKQYGAAEKVLESYKQKLTEISKPGTSLKAYQALARDVLALEQVVKNLDARLQALAAAGPTIDPTKAQIKIIATQETYDGQPLGDIISNGDIIALQGTVDIPGEDGEMLKSSLIWQLLDHTGRQIGDYFKEEEIWKAGTSAHTKVRFLMDGLKSGSYTAALTHIPTDAPDKIAQARVPFEINAPLTILDAWVTDTPKGSLVNVLQAGRNPFFYVTFEVDPGVQSVQVMLSAKAASSGAGLAREDITYEVKPKRKVQRIGIMLEQEALEGVHKIDFVAELNTADSDILTAEQSVELIQDTYPLTVRAAPTILSGQSGKFSIKLPAEFESPYQMKFSSRLQVSQSGTALKGSFTGTARGNDQRETLKVAVTDSKGRRATGQTTVTVKAEDPRVAESQEQPEFYSTTRPPEPSSNYTPADTGGDDAADLGRRRVSKLMADVASGVGPPCASSLTAPYQQSIVNTLRGVLGNEAELRNLGAMSSYAYDQYVVDNVWKPLGTALARAVANSPKSACYQGMLSNFVGVGYLTPSSAQDAINDNDNNGGGSVAPVQPLPPWARPPSAPSSQPTQPRTPTCTNTKIDTDAAWDRLMHCMYKTCPQTGQEGSDCRMRCDKGDWQPFLKRSCPNGVVNGTGKDLSCRVCQ